MAPIAPYCRGMGLPSSRAATMDRSFFRPCDFAVQAQHLRRSRARSGDPLPRTIRSRSSWRSMTRFTCSTPRRESNSGLSWDRRAMSRVSRCRVTTAGSELTREGFVAEVWDMESAFTSDAAQHSQHSPLHVVRGERASSSTKYLFTSERFSTSAWSRDGRLVASRFERRGRAR